ncbi:helix-turn-helix domain-containing protein [Bacteroides cellulosilyticus]|jgi:transcriptional regulator with XRE-family HTH domain|uniref:XRE family transcriptional regulator n=1 Tax=Bacteroides cellulosilyticus TaxID=246787 RepID=A0A412IK00_9BACE|nr:helix-turn-helix transcriptional regulator [Bacteroides cellulosilyticus]RGS37823.1 XRE family transcriptional regulator [Bacteroides cellulosilyticus]
MELRIKDVLKEKKVTVVSLAGMIGIAQPSMSNIVNGKSMPSLETLEKIATALEVPFTELFEQPKTGTVSLSCPHCGKSITLKAE